MGGTSSQNNKFRLILNTITNYNQPKKLFRAIDRAVKWWVFIAEITEVIKLACFLYTYISSRSVHTSVTNCLFILFYFFFFKYVLGWYSMKSLT